MVLLSARHYLSTRQDSQCKTGFLVQDRIKQRPGSLMRVQRQLKTAAKNTVEPGLRETKDTALNARSLWPA
eukprot:scaffold51263_cov15-Tisochrysis_lutea.AAC.1